MFRLTVETDNLEELKKFAAMIADNETMEDVIDDLAGDVNVVRGRVSDLELKMPDPNKMFDETYTKVKKMLDEKDKQKKSGKKTRQDRK